MQQLPKGIELRGQQYVEVDGDRERDVSPAYVARLNAAQNTGPVRAAMIGMGETFTNIGDLAAQGLGIDRPQRGDAEIRALEQERPISTMVGSAAPAVAAGLALPATLPAQIGGGAVADYAMGSPGERGRDAGLGMVFGGVFDIAGRVLSNIATARKIPKSFEAQRFENAGGKTTPAQQLGDQESRLYNRERSFLSSQYPPKKLTRTVEHNAQHGRQLLAKAAYGDEAMPADVVARGMDTANIHARKTELQNRLGAFMDSHPGIIMGRNAVEDLDVLDAKAARDLDALIRENSNQASTVFRERGGRTWDEIRAQAVKDGGLQMTGQELFYLRQMATERVGEGGRWAAGWRDMRDQLDGYIQDGLGSDGAAAFQDTNAKYEILQLIDDKAVGGDISYRNFRRALKGRYDDRLQRGTAPDEIKQLWDFVDSGSASGMQANFGRSGTPEGVGDAFEGSQIRKAIEGRIYMGTADKPVGNYPGAVMRDIVGDEASQFNAKMGRAANALGGTGVLEYIDQNQ